MNLVRTEGLKLWHWTHKPIGSVLQGSVIVRSPAQAALPTPGRHQWPTCSDTAEVLGGLLRRMEAPWLGVMVSTTGLWARSFCTDHDDFGMLSGLTSYRPPLMALEIFWINCLKGLTDDQLVDTNCKNHPKSFYTLHLELDKSTSFWHPGSMWTGYWESLSSCRIIILTLNRIEFSQAVPNALQSSWTGPIRAPFPRLLTSGEAVQARPGLVLESISGSDFWGPNLQTIAGECHHQLLIEYDWIISSNS